MLRNGLSLIIQKDNFGEALRSDCQIIFERLHTALLKRDLPFCVSFAAHVYCWLDKINIVRGEVCEFRYPDACLEKHLKDGVVSRVSASQGEHFCTTLRLKARM